MIRVALDQAHTRQSAAGTARYSRALARALRQSQTVDLVELAEGEAVKRTPIRKQLLTMQQDFVWYPWLGRRRAEVIGADVYHCPTPRAPLTRSSLPLIVTIHDLVSVLFPWTMTPWSRFYGQLTLPRVLRAADLLIACSHDTANDLNRLMKVSPDRIRVVWNGVDDLFFSTRATASPVSDPYVLFVGTPEPRKNLPRLVEAIRILRSRGRSERLCVVGGRGWGDVTLASPDVDVVGQVSDLDLQRYYAHAQCVVLPSLHEGFGLPVIEAMASGVPVVASDRGALPEIAGDAAVLVNPEQPGDIARGIEQALAERSALIQSGHERASIFRWTATAEATIRVYREVS